MTPEQISLVKESFRKVVPIAGVAADLFYDRRFATAPKLCALFPEDTTEQKQKLMAMLGTAVGNLHQMDRIALAVQDLGKRHASYGVTLADYQPVGDALLWTLEQGLGGDVTPPVKAAWLEAYVTLLGRRPPAPKRANRSHVARPCLTLTSYRRPFRSQPAWNGSCITIGQDSVLARTAKGPAGTVALVRPIKGSDSSPPGAPTPGELRDSTLKIVIVDESPIRAAILEDGLREAGFMHVERIRDTNNLLKRIYAIDPDVILIDLENPSRDVLEHMFQMSRVVKRPVAMFVDQSDSASIQAAVDAGVSAYIVDGLKKERITSILDLCISRFNAFARLQSELDRAKDALEERKVIDRAKGVLMKAKNLSEEDAYALLRKTAMNENKKIIEIAQSVMTAAELFK
jgi:response regulator NasT